MNPLAFYESTDVDTVATSSRRIADAPLVRDPRTEHQVWSRLTLTQPIVHPQVLEQALPPWSHRLARHVVLEAAEVVDGHPRLVDPHELRPFDPLAPLPLTGHAALLEHLGSEHPAFVNHVPVPPLAQRLPSPDGVPHLVTQAIQLLAVAIQHGDPRAQFLALERLIAVMQDGHLPTSSTQVPVVQAAPSPWQPEMAVAFEETAWVVGDAVITGGPGYATYQDANHTYRWSIGASTLCGATGDVLQFEDRVSGAWLYWGLPQQTWLTSHPVAWSPYRSQTSMGIIRMASGAYTALWDTPHARWIRAADGAHLGLLVNGSGWVFREDGHWLGTVNPYANPPRTFACLNREGNTTLVEEYPRPGGPWALGRGAEEQWFAEGNLFNEHRHQFAIDIPAQTAAFSADGTRLALVTATEVVWISTTQRSIVEIWPRPAPQDN